MSDAIPANPVLEGFKTNLPYRPYAMREKGSGCHPVAASKASRYPYIQANQPAMMHWLIFDLDHDYARLAWIDAKVPQPTIMVLSKDTGRGHYLYRLRTPVCTSAKGRIKPIKMAAAIEAGLCGHLDADPRYTGLLCKNPLSDAWDVIVNDVDFELQDLLRWGDWDGCYRPKEPRGLGRNCDLFDRLRAWAYRERQNHTNRVKWDKAVYDMAFALNDFPNPLKISEVRATAKSVTKWVWEKYRGSGRTRNRGTMSLPAHLSKAEKQRLGGEHAAEQRVARTHTAIDGVVVELAAAGKAITQRAVAAHSGLSLSTIKRHWDRAAIFKEAA